MTYARTPVAPDRVGRTAMEEWFGALTASHLPIAFADADATRPRIAFAAPLAAAAAGERELVDLYLVERLPIWRIRSALEPLLPAGHRWLSAEDVWPGEPPLPGQVVFADWRVIVTWSSDSGLTPGDLGRAAARVLAAPAIPLTRSKGGVEKEVDLRPFLDRIELVEPETPERRPRDTVAIDLRLAVDPERGAGRPDEVVAAIAEAAGTAFQILELTRRGLVLAAETGLPSRPVRATPPSAATRRPRRAD
ncbi:MAG TPA: DUF2344 domain-containing protein [Candidatus Limnocylindrales bacterium]|nr:DUF2344 domain-containing protein [Candidatus Limnocylindrales bacterium]